MSLEQLAAAMGHRYGAAFATRWLAQQRPAPHPAPPAPPQSRQEPFYEHESHRGATELLEPYREALGASYETLHLMARCSIEHATERDPAPHLMTTYWTLEEALGKCERTLRRHLIEDGHPWSETVRHLIDIRHNYGTRLDGKDEEGQDKYQPCITSMVMRFFSRGRLSPNARVKRWGRRDLLSESDEGRTRATRPASQESQRERYERVSGRMSAYSSVKEQSCENNWCLVKLGQTVSCCAAQKESPGSLYADIPKNLVLEALRQDLGLGLENARARGANLKRARSRWVDTAARVLAARHGDDKPLPRHESERHVTHHDGFTDLWRRVLWTAVKAEMYGGTDYGWHLIERMVALAGDAEREGLERPAAYAWSRVREEVEVLRRDYGSGSAGACLVA